MGPQADAAGAWSLVVSGTKDRSELDAALATIEEDELGRICRELAEIQSPTGEELDAASYLCRTLREAGVDAELQRLDARRANVVARLASGRPGPTVLLLASLDTAFSGDDVEDRPWLGDDRRLDFRLTPTLEDGNLIGLGAENPKAFATSVAAAVKAVAAAGGPAAGTLLMGIVAGGMPITGRPGLDDRTIGFGSGTSHLLQRGFRPDWAVLAKPGWAIQNEETGLCWFRVDVRGTLSYTGTRQLLHYRSAIVDAAKVVVALEEWFAEYAARHASEYLSPQGSIGAIHAGGPGRSAFVPPVCSFYVDLRTDPSVSPARVHDELRDALARISAAHDDIGLESTMLVSVPGGRTDQRSPLVRAMVEEWERVEGTTHEPRRRLSGISDAAVLRGLGIPTAVVGLPQTPKPEPFAGFSMGVVRQESMGKLAQLLVRSAMRLCSDEFAGVAGRTPITSGGDT
jgi:acetylornithine deacetylase/succinyl-diaminopimelate desuccinylase-like protein